MREVCEVLVVCALGVLVISDPFVLPSFSLLLYSYVCSFASTSSSDIFETMAV